MHVESVSLVSPISMALSFWMRRHDKYTDQVRRANPIFVVHGDLQLLEIAISRHSYAAFMLFLDTISNPIPVANGAADLTLEAPEVPEAAAQPASPRSAHAPASPRSAQPASPRSAHAPASPRSAQPASPRSTHVPASPRSAHAPASPARLHTSASAHPENEDEADEFFDASDVLHMVADPMLVSTVCGRLNLRFMHLLAVSHGCKLALQPTAQCDQVCRGCCPRKAIQARTDRCRRGRRGGSGHDLANVCREPQHFRGSKKSNFFRTP